VAKSMTLTHRTIH